MKNNELNIFITDTNKLVVNGLKYYLQNRYGQCVKVYTFNNMQNCLEKLDEEIEMDVLIMDPEVYGNDPETLSMVRSINPKAAVIPLSNNETIALMLETFKQGITDFMNGKGASESR
jgi:DNA-binding NarL/FixJ family response regulator